ncbi:phosphatidylglycerophosphatase A family protein [Paenibacillus wulumuqiensis]|uniref:phosphatidylglycerophosphatase A family protein n=1 Tax=Paenibacillus wulumuqiensis TaxID=1567107 RepID=UPI000619EB49|nr:phosphatidylglycerophosphatase A [Paenibacillus wulumuqiensis]
MENNESGKMPYSLYSLNVEQATREWLSKRGVTIREIAELVLFLQQSYYPDLTIEECEQSVNKVLMKREVQNALLTGVQLDILAEKGQLISPLQEMIENDEGLYGVDEILAFAIVNVYGSIGFTNYGYIDKLKPGVLGRLNDKSLGPIHTFFDDIVGAIAAAASSRIAHGRQMDDEQHNIDTAKMDLPEDDEATEH